MPVAVTAVTATVTVLNGTFTLVQTCYNLAGVDEDLKICLELLANADRDLNYARTQLRSRKSNQSHVQFSSIDLNYFEGVIDKMEAAAIALGQLVQGYRVERDVNKNISIGSRFSWVLQGKERFANRKDVLMMAHSSLLGVSKNLGPVGPVTSYAIPPPPYDASRNLAPTSSAKILRSPSQQRALKGKSSMILRPDSIPIQTPSTPVSQNRQSPQQALKPSLPTVLRERRKARGGFRQRVTDVSEELEFDGPGQPGVETL